MSEIRNLKGSINLMKLENASLLKVEINGEKRTCVCIPVRENDLFYHKNGGMYLGINVIETREPQFENTHFLKQAHSKKFNESLTESQRLALPIIGNARPLVFDAPTPPPAPVATSEPADISPDIDDLPF